MRGNSLLVSDSFGTVRRFRSSVARVAPECGLPSAARKIEIVRLRSASFVLLDLRLLTESPLDLLRWLQPARQPANADFRPRVA
jgi:hypothetical protein